MSKKLYKISKELRIGISEIVAFLNRNGYSCEEEPSVKLDDKVVEFIYRNIKGSVNSYENSAGNISLNKTKSIGESIKKVPNPLELRIVEAASKNKKIVERIIGFTDFDWFYTVAQFSGTCSQPVKFNLFDETICGILLKEEMSEKEIGKVMGLDVENDPAERGILQSAIKDLKKDKMVDGDESVLWLTDTGREYAQHGVKFSTFERDFELYFDEIGDLKKSAKEVFSDLKSERQSDFDDSDAFETIEDVRSIAEVQAPEIHFPAEQFILQSYEYLRTNLYKAKVWVVLLDNFRDNTTRALVYDEKQDKIIEPLSLAFDKLENKKREVFEKIMRESVDDDFVVSPTDEEKQNIQLQQEAALIEKQKEYDIAVNNNDTEKITAINKEVHGIKRHYNSLEFEMELKRLFDETADELWIISPWIKRYAAIRRIPFFENYLKKGGRIFVAYSLPEKEGDVMADEDALNSLRELEDKYHNFYIHQLPVFHYKRVWLKANAGNIYYTGSYNILSFFVKQGQKKYRQEEMSRLDWNSENDEEYKKIFLSFGDKYLNQAIEALRNLSKKKERAKVVGKYQSKLKIFLDNPDGMDPEKIQTWKELISR